MRRRAAMTPIMSFVCMIFLSSLPMERGLAEINCPEPPKQIENDVLADVKGKIGKLGPVSAGDLHGQVSVIAKDLIVKYPNADKIAISMALISTTCEFLKSSPSLTDKQKLEENRILRKDILSLFHGDGSKPTQEIVDSSVDRSVAEIAYRIDRLEGSLDTGTTPDYVLRDFAQNLDAGPPMFPEFKDTSFGGLLFSVRQGVKHQKKKSLGELIALHKRLIDGKSVRAACQHDEGLESMRKCVKRKFLNPFRTII